MSQQDMPVVESMGRIWTQEWGCYSAYFESDKGDKMVARFERAPILNRVELPVYGEDCDEILKANRDFIVANNLLN